MCAPEPLVGDAPECYAFLGQYVARHLESLDRFCSGDRNPGRRLFIIIELRRTGHDREGPRLERLVGSVHFEFHDRD